MFPVIQGAAWPGRLTRSVLPAQALCVARGTAATWGGVRFPPPGGRRKVGWRPVPDEGRVGTSVPWVQKQPRRPAGSSSRAGSCGWVPHVWVLPLPKASIQLATASTTLGPSLCCKDKNGSLNPADDDIEAGAALCTVPLPNQGYQAPETYSCSSSCQPCPGVSGDNLPGYPGYDSLLTDVP